MINFHKRTAAGFTAGILFTGVLAVSAPASAHGLGVRQCFSRGRMKYHVTMPATMLNMAIAIADSIRKPAQLKPRFRGAFAGLVVSSRVT